MTHPGNPPAVWFTSCRVPTATATAQHNHLLDDVTATTGVSLRHLRDLEPEHAEHHHQHHDVALFREGGNIPPLWTRSRGAATRLIGLTWIEEGQVILARPDSGITGPADLRGLRAAVPAARVRQPQLQRPVALHGLTGALALAGLDLDAVELVEVGSGEAPVDAFWRGRGAPAHPAIDAVADGRADIAYAVGPVAADHAARLGLVTVIDLDAYPDRTTRVNLGSPRALTVDQSTLDDHPQLVVDYLTRLLRAADRARADNVGLVASIVAQSGASPSAVRAIYGPHADTDLRPRLTDELLGLYRRQKDFLLRHGFIHTDFDVHAWADPEPLRLATLAVDATAARLAA
ncbi:hypothetical protein AB0I61_16095 [Polymorphospora rubra]|uniref:ABC transporter substrate-binding protein n=1 Tax=Polymorphospora rubra TaxID=338584 RepID=UPI003404E653